MAWGSQQGQPGAHFWGWARVGVLWEDCWDPQAKCLHPTCLPTEELELELRDGRMCMRARLSLAEGLSWGPFHGSIQPRASSPGQAEPVSTLVTTTSRGERPRTRAQDWGQRAECTA